MRPRRHVLQVSTFPFLAVLLCAMGSLILLLLVIDRRARAVAQAKAAQALARAATEDAKVAASRAAELERRRQALHDGLTNQDRDVLTQVRAVQKQEASAAEKLRAEQDHAKEFESEWQSESGRLEREEQALRNRVAELSKTTEKTQESQKELARLTGDLVRLERTLRDLKEARKRDSQRYSLVPYRGHKGDNRRPHYVECTGSGVIFHPDRVALERLQLTLGNVRTETERRIARRRAAAATPKEKEETPYLLLLVRPEGIKNYYKTLTALEGLKVDFGYECVEADWVLDFPEKEDGSIQPWMVADQPPAPRLALPVASAPKPTPTLTGGNTSQPVGVNFGGSEIKNRTAGPGGDAASGSGSDGPTGPVTSPALELRAPTLGIPVGGTKAAGIGAVPGGLSSGFGGSELRSGGSVFGPEGNGSASANAIAPPGQAGAEQGIPDRTPRSGEKNGPEFPASPQQARGPEKLLAPRGTPSNGQSSDGAPMPGGGNGQPGANALPGQPPPSAGTTAAPAMAQSANGNGDSGARPTPGRRGKTAFGEDMGQPGDEAAVSPRKPELSPFPPNPPAASKPVVPERPRVFGNRDWTISVECKAEGVVTYPGSGRFTLETLTQAAPGNNPLFQAVQGMIARRQAMVRTGEPPYRPIIRFRVHPDGLRSYYLAYPALEALHVPMTRENVRREAAEGRP